VAGDARINSGHHSLPLIADLMKIRVANAAI